MTSASFGSSKFVVEFQLSIPPGYSDPIFLRHGSLGPTYVVREDFSGGFRTLSIINVDTADKAEQMQKHVRFLSRLKHPNISRLLSIHNAPNTLFVIREYVGMKTLTEFITEKDGGLNSLSPTDCYILLSDILHGLIFLEKEGFSIADLTTDSVTVNEEGRARLDDLYLSESIPFLSSSCLLSSIRLLFTHQLLPMQGLPPLFISRNHIRTKGHITINEPNTPSFSSYLPQYGFGMIALSVLGGAGVFSYLESKFVSNQGNNTNKMLEGGKKNFDEKTGKEKEHKATDCEPIFPLTDLAESLGLSDKSLTENTLILQCFAKTPPPFASLVSLLSHILPSTTGSPWEAFQARAETAERCEQEQNERMEKMWEEIGKLHAEIDRLKKEASSPDEHESYKSSDRNGTDRKRRGSEAVSGTGRKDRSNSPSSLIEEPSSQDPDRKDSTSPGAHLRRLVGLGCFSFVDSKHHTIQGNVITRIDDTFSPLISQRCSEGVIRLRFRIRQVSSYLHAGIIADALMDQARGTAFSDLRGSARWDLKHGSFKCNGNSEAYGSCRKGKVGDEIVMECDLVNPQRTAMISVGGTVGAVCFTNIPVPFRFIFNLNWYENSIEILSIETDSIPLLKGATQFEKMYD
ncbi:hypothetical protein BLNAU_9532 [Blattamonas nauphoetae]|uniref:Protein kinase domain-containing protein n=1 Tax=Blattamonas nauphoetae TaxID=2049346 RepID=A0ABQ9XVI0_9EUKA|nr:hypothetical protein BLNAU_9532 [Blattamonas nauphoetae]